MDRGLAEPVPRELRALHPGSDIGEGGVASGGHVIAERREAAVVGAAESFRAQVLRRFEDAVADLLGGLDARIDGVLSWVGVLSGL